VHCKPHADGPPLISDVIHPHFMNIEALAIIGTLSIFVGGLLYLPFYLWMRWKKKKGEGPKSRFNVRLTGAGITFYGCMVVMLFVGFAQEHLAPHSAFGAFVSSREGRLAYAGGMLALWVTLEFILTKFGFKFVKPTNEDV